MKVICKNANTEICPSRACVHGYPHKNKEFFYDCTKLIQILVGQTLNNACIVGCAEYIEKENK